MLKLSKNGIGALTAQYRSVLKKCFILNMCAAGLMLFSAAAHAETGMIYDSDNLDSLSNFITEVNPEDLAADTPIALYMHKSENATVNGYLTGEQFGEIDKAWIRNYGDMGIGYTYDATSGVQEYSGETTISNKHNITALHVGTSGGAISNIYNVHATGTGGDLDTEFNIRNTVFENNSSTYFDIESAEDVSMGGAIVNVNPNTATITDSTLTQNYVINFVNAKGGAVYNGPIKPFAREGSETLASIASSGTTFDGNVAGDLSSAAVTAGVQSNIVDERSTQATALGHSIATEHAMGGAIANEGEYSSVNDTFTNNIARGTEAKGGAIYNNSYTTSDGRKIGGVFNLSGTAEFSDNAAENESDGGNVYGGAIYNNYQFTVADDATLTFERNMALSNGENSFGGAVYNDGEGTINLSGTFSENSSLALEEGKSAYGGAVANAGEMTIANATFGENVARSGENGQAFGGAIYNDKTLNLNGSTFEANEANSPSGTNNGGALANGEHGTVIMSDNVFERNESSGADNSFGGAVYNEGNINSNGDRFTSNTAAEGGAIYNAGTFTASTINTTENTADEGGAIYNTGTAELIGGVVSNNTADNNGGAVYNTGVYTSSDIDYTNNEANGGDIDAAFGGAIYNDANVTIAGGNFTENTAEASRATGGAIYNSNNNSKVTLQSDTTFENNSATGEEYAVGGAFYNDAAGTIETSSGATLQFVKNVAEAGEGKYAAGGAVYNAGNLTLDNAEFSENTASSGIAEGGAIYNEDSGIITLKNAKFEENKTTGFDDEGTATAHGGAISNNGGEVSVSNSSFAANEAQGVETQGGAIYNEEDGTVNSSNNVYDANVAKEGAAIYNEGIFNSIEDVVKNHANRAVYNADTYTSEGSEYTDNAGAVYNEGTFTSVGDKYIGNSVEDEEALGGAIYNDNPIDGGNAVFNMSGAGELSNNFVKATAGGLARGGAVYNDAQFNVEGNELKFADNYAEGSVAEGGALFNGKNGEMKVAGTFTNNLVNGTTVGFGGAAYNEGILTIANGSSFKGNSVTADDAMGGAVYNALENSLDITASEFAGNTVTSTSTSEDALTGGGAIANYGGLTVTDSTFENNTLTGENTAGGAIYNTGVTIATGNSYKNHTANAGGAVYNEGLFTSDGDKYIGNSAQGDEIAFGGAIYNDTPGEDDVDNGQESSSDADATEGVFNLKGSAGFEGNFAKVTAANGVASGGAIYNDAQFNTEGNTLEFISNYAEGANAAGGAVYNEDDGVMSLAGTFNGNYADAVENAQGGAVYNAGELTIGKAAFNNNDAQGKIAEGGAVYTENTLNLDNVAFNNNTAEGDVVHGGALASKINDAANTMDIFASTFAGNTAEGTEEGLGGALYNANINALTNIVDTSFDNNSIVLTNENGKALGGAIYNEGAENEITMLSLTAETADVSISGNEVKVSSGNVPTGEFYGGALFNGTYGKATIATEGGNIIVDGNKALNGGAIYNTADGKSTVIEGESVSTSLEIDAANGDITFSANEAIDNGGAIYNSTNSSGNQIGFYVSATNGSDVTFADNKAVNGGALQNVDNSNARLTLGDGGAEIRFVGNKAGEKGGAINNDASKIEILNSAGDPTASSSLIFANNEATSGGAINNINGAKIVGNIKNDVTVLFDNNKSAPNDLSGAIYNDSDSRISLNIGDTTKVVFNTESDTVFNADGGIITITGDNESPVEREDEDLKPENTKNLASSQNQTSFANVDPEKTQVVLNATFTGNGVYDISNTQFNLGSTGFIDDGSAKILRYDPQMHLKNNEVNLAENSFMYLTDYNDKLTNNDFYLDPNATLRFTDLFETSDFVLANHIENEGTVKYIAAQKDTDVRLGTSIINAGTIDVADSVLTNVHIGTLQSQDGNQIIIDLDNPNLKADIVTIDKRIYNATNTITNIYFADYNDKTEHKILAETELEVGERIYFAQTQSEDHDLENTFAVVNGKNSEYEIKMGNEKKGDVWDWFLYREATPPPPPPPPGPDPMDPEDLAAIDLPRAAVEQLRSIRLPVSRTNRGQCSCYEDNCSNYFCQYENSPKTRLWATPFYKWGNYEAPVDTDFKIWGVDFGMDYQPTSDDMIGVFGSYRNGEYENDGKGKKKSIFSALGSKLDIDSWIGGLYYRKYFGNFYMLGSAFGGKLDVDMKAKNKVKASTDGYDVGAEIEMGYDIHSSARSTWTPSVRGRYDHIKFDDWKDTNGKKAEFDALNHFEIEAALKYEYQFNGEHELPTTGYIKPSVIQTIANGGDVKVDGKEFKDTIDNETFGRIEIGADAEIVKNFSIGAFGNYTVGSKYDAWMVGGNVRYVW